MAPKKKQKLNGLEFEAQSVAEPPENKAPEPPAIVSPVAKKRLSVALKEDGSLDLDSMRDSTKRELTDAISKSQLLGVADPSRPAEAVARPKVFSPEACGSFYGMLGSIEAAVISRMYKVPPEIAIRVFTYTEAERAMLAEPTANVMNKYASGWMIRYQEEINLGSMLVAITIQKMTMLRAVMAQVQAAPIPQPPQPGPQPVADKESEPQPVQ